MWSTWALSRGGVDIADDQSAAGWTSTRLALGLIVAARGRTNRRRVA